MRVHIFFSLLTCVAVVGTACGSDSDSGSADPESTCLAGTDIEAIEVDPTADLSGTEITLATHDSFFLSEGVLDAFTTQTGIKVTQVAGGDAGAVLSAAILTKDNPSADVLFGIDNTLLCRGLDADLFVPYSSAALTTVPAELDLDPAHRVTPIDYSDVCINYWTDALPGEAPTSLDDLIDPVNADQFVTENPETSSPGLAFLLATIARYGDDGWEAYWAELVDNGVTVTSGWEEAYNGEFAAGGGDRSIVTSYASSPPAEVLFADPPITEAPSKVLFDSCYRQIEFAGVLSGTDHPEAAARLVDFLLSDTVQNDVPLAMFVYPASTTATLPPAFVEYGRLDDDPLMLDPATIEANRDRWTERWTEIVLRS